MSNERDELAAMRGELAELTADAAERDDDDWMTEAATAILAAGYRKPGTVTTVEELDALHDGSSVLCLDAAGEGHPAQKHADGWGLPFSSELWSARHLLDGCESITVIQEWAAQ